jgi:hypothetical protein
VKRMVCIVPTVVLLLAWIGQPAVGQVAGPGMSVAVGLDGYCRTGNWCPVYAVLSNEGADIEGELRVAVGWGAGLEPDVYSREIVLPAHSRKAYYLYIPSGDPSSSRSRIEVRLVAGEKVLSSESVTVAWLGERDRLYGVASSSPSALNSLSDVAPSGANAAVAHLDLDMLPLNALVWEGLDVLVLNDVDTAALSGEREGALETWLAHGGHLIVGGGAGAARTTAGVGDLLPVAVGGTRSVDTLWALGERTGAPLADGPYAVAESDLRDGEALVEQAGLILWARRGHGVGRVDFLAFDAGLNPFVRWEDNIELWERIVSTATAGTRRLTIRNGYRAHDAISAIPGLEVPSTLCILGFMLLYTMLIGPINYVVLRKLDRRELAWLTIPVLVLGFSACAYTTGFQVRGGRAIVHRLAVVHVPEGGRTGRVSQMVGLFSPRRTNYDVWVAGAGVRGIPGDTYGGPDGQPLHVVEEAEGSTVTDLRVDIGGIQPFIAEGYVDVPGIEADLRLVGPTSSHSRLEGRLRSEISLQDAVLIVGSDEQRLGDLEAGQSYTVGVTFGSSLPPFQDLVERIMGSGSYYGDRNLNRRYQFLQAVFDPYGYNPYGSRLPGGSGLGPGVHLLGWVEEDVPFPVEVVDRPYSSVATALYVYDLPVLEVGTTHTIPPSLIEREIVETSGYVDVWWPSGLRMDTGAKVVLRFTVWSWVPLPQAVDELVVDMQGGGSMAQSPTVSLWNLETGDWEQLSIGWGQHSIPNAEAYVAPSGEVLVQLETDDRSTSEVESLTITIKGQQ